MRCAEASVSAVGRSSVEYTALTWEVSRPDVAREGLSCLMCIGDAVRTAPVALKGELSQMQVCMNA